MQIVRARRLLLLLSCRECLLLRLPSLTRLDLVNNLVPEQFGEQFAAGLISFAGATFSPSFSVLQL